MARLTLLAKSMEGLCSTMELDVRGVVETDDMGGVPVIEDADGAYKLRTGGENCTQVSKECMG